MRLLSLLLIFLLLSSCGRKAPPIPYGEGGSVENLEAPTQFQAHFREGHLRLLALWPGYKKQGSLMVEVLQSPKGCGQCEATTEFRLLLNPGKRPQPLLVGLLQRTRIHQIKWSLAQPIVIEFPAEFFGDELQEGKLKFQLVPMTPAGDRGRESESLSPNQPLPLAPPKIKVTKHPACLPPQCKNREPLRLQLQWEGAEAIGGGVYLKKSLGVNLYQIQKGKEVKLAGPLYQGHHWISDPKSKIQARSQDPWGNESAPLTLYEAEQSQ